VCTNWENGLRVKSDLKTYLNAHNFQRGENMNILKTYAERTKLDRFRGPEELKYQFMGFETIVNFNLDNKLGRDRSEFYYYRVLVHLQTILNAILHDFEEYPVITIYEPEPESTLVVEYDFIWKLRSKTSFYDLILDPFPAVLNILREFENRFSNKQLKKLIQDNLDVLSEWEERNVRNSF
jgi:hypothetical protein